MIVIPLSYWPHLSFSGILDQQPADHDAQAEQGQAGQVVNCAETRKRGKISLEGTTGNALVYCRATPEDKVVVLQSLQKDGHVVAVS